MSWATAPRGTLAIDLTEFQTPRVERVAGEVVVVEEAEPAAQTPTGEAAAPPEIGLTVEASPATKRGRSAPSAEPLDQSHPSSGIAARSPRPTGRAPSGSSAGIGTAPTVQGVEFLPLLVTEETLKTGISLVS